MGLHADKIKPTDSQSSVSSSMTQWCLQEVRKLTSALAGNTTLEELTACNQVLSVDDARCFASALRSNSTLRSLSIGHSTFGDEAAAALAEGLSGATLLLEWAFTMIMLQSSGRQSRPWCYPDIACIHA